MHILTRVDEMILREVDRRGQVRSLFALTIDLCLNYSGAHKRVTHLEGRGLLRVEQDRAGRGQPLVLSRPPDSVRQLSFGGSLQTCNGTLGARDAKR